VIYAAKETTSKSFGIERPDVAAVHGAPASKWGFRTSTIISTGPIDETKLVLRFDGGIDVPILIYGVPLDESIEHRRKSEYFSMMSLVASRAYKIYNPW
jgi:hypothetical protein